MDSLTQTAESDPRLENPYAVDSTLAGPHIGYLELWLVLETRPGVRTVTKVIGDEVCPDVILCEAARLRMRRDGFPGRLVGTDSAGTVFLSIPTSGYGLPSKG